MVKDARSLLEERYTRILAGKRLPPQNKAEGMSSNIDYVLKMFKLKWFKVIPRFTKYLSNYRLGSQHQL